MSADAGMSSRDYEREAEASRHRLAGSLRELNDRLSPGQVFDEVLSYARGGGGTFLSALSNAAKDNPVPSLLIGAGLLMFLSEKTGLSHMMQGRSDGRTDAYRGDGDAYRGRYSDNRYGDFRGRQGPGMAQSMASGVRDAAGNAMEGARNAAGQVAGTARKGMEGVGAAVAGAAQGARNAAANVGNGIADAGSGLANAADRLKQQAQGLGGTVRDTAMDFGGTLRDSADAMSGTMRDTAGVIRERLAETAQEAPRRVAETVNQAKEGINSLVAEQPLIVGALGLAIGAAIAAVLPKTEVEDELMGEASDNLKNAVGALANEQMATAGTLAAKVATDVVSDISQVAERQGVTPQAAASVVRNATDKIKEAVGLPPTEGKPDDRAKAQKGTTT